MWKKRKRTREMGQLLMGKKERREVRECRPRTKLCGVTVCPCWEGKSGEALKKVGGQA
jgi:hypothetical protein